MATNWLSYYRSNRQDGSSIQRLFSTDQDVLAEVAKANLGSPSHLSSTISGSDFANILLVPGEKDLVKVIHHGFDGASTYDLATDSTLVFVHGNFCEAPFKVLDRSQATNPIFRAGGTRSSGACPTLTSFVGSTSANDFAALRAENNTILKDRPSHMFIHPAILTLAEGAREVSASSLAWKIIDSLTAEADADAQQIQEYEEAQGQAEGLLAFLWASAMGVSSSVGLTDPPDLEHLNHRCERVRDKIRASTNNNGGGDGLGSGAGLAALTVAAQQIAASSLSTEQMRITDKQERKDAKSILRALGPNQQKLWHILCTPSMRVEPKMTAFVESLVSQKTPQKAINLLEAESTRWKGTFSRGAIHRFLATGFASQEHNKANPAGFTILMFYPKTIQSSGKPFNKTNAQMREYLELDADDETIAYLLKEELFTPMNVHDLLIQLETAHDMLQLLTMPDSIAVQGLGEIIDRFDDNFTEIQECFATIPSFGAKFVYSIDRSLQRFFQIMMESKDVQAESGETRRFLITKAKRLMETIEDGEELGTILPSCLQHGSGLRVVSDQPK